MLFSAINTSRFLLDNLRAYVLFFHICTFLHILDYFFDTYLVRKEGQKGM